MSLPETARTVRTQRVAARRASIDAPSPSPTIPFQIIDLIERSGAQRMMVVYLDEFGATNVITGKVRSVLRFEGVDFLLFDDGLQIPLAAITNAAIDLEQR